MIYLNYSPNVFVEYRTLGNIGTLIFLLNILNKILNFAICFMQTMPFKDANFEILDAVCNNYLTWCIDIHIELMREVLEKTLHD